MHHIPVARGIMLCPRRHCTAFPQRGQGRRGGVGRDAAGNNKTSPTRRDRPCRALWSHILAEGEGFEPPWGVNPKWFSRPPRSTALPSLRSSRRAADTAEPARRARTAYPEQPQYSNEKRANFRARPTLFMKPQGGGAPAVRAAPAPADLPLSDAGCRLPCR